MSTVQDRDNLLQSIKQQDLRFDERCNRVFIALAEYQNGFPLDRACLRCEAIIALTGVGDPVCAWKIDCECHECKSTFRGL